MGVWVGIDLNYHSNLPVHWFGKVASQMKYLSLFSGIGGFELGIQQAYGTKISIRDGQRE